MKIIGMILVALPLFVGYIICKMENIVNAGMDGWGYTCDSGRW